MYNCANGVRTIFPTGIFSPVTVSKTELHDDVQARRPSTHLSLTRVGVTGVEKVVRISVEGSEPQLFYAQLECFVDLNPLQKGAHMSRFEETVNEAIEQVVLNEAFKAEWLAPHIAPLVRGRQDSLRAEGQITARYPEYKPAPVSGVATQEIYTLHGSAVASATGTRRLVGVSAQGMTACPCAQEMVTAASRERLLADGFTDDEIERVFEHVPVATHNQRGIGTLWVGCPEGCDREIHGSNLLRIVEEAMTPETFQLSTPPAEHAIGDRAHRRPRFVEDCVREQIRMALIEFAEFEQETFIMARQEN